MCIKNLIDSNYTGKYNTNNTTGNLFFNDINFICAKSSLAAAVEMSLKIIKFINLFLHCTDSKHNKYRYLALLVTTIALVHYYIISCAKTTSKIRHLKEYNPPPVLAMLY